MAVSSADKIPKVAKWMRTISLCLCALSAAFLLLMMFIGSADVFAGQVLRKPISAAFELVCILMVGVIWLAMPYVEQERSQIAITVLFERAGLRLQNLLRLLTSLLTLGLGGLLSFMAFKRMVWSIGLGERFPNGQFPISAVRVVFFVAVCLMAAAALLWVVRDSTRVVSGTKPTEQRGKSWEE